MRFWRNRRKRGRRLRQTLTSALVFSIISKVQLFEDSAVHVPSVSFGTCMIEE